MRVGPIVVMGTKTETADLTELRWTETAMVSSMLRIWMRVKRLPEGR